MEITVNGNKVEQPEGASASRLLDNLKIDPQRAVVELNGAIVERAKLSETLLKAGDRVEIVRFVGGG